MKQKKILVTGALGMLGRELVQELIHVFPQNKLILMDVLPLLEFEKLRNEIWQNSSDLEYFQVDILNEKRLRELLLDCSVLYHLAGIVSYSLKMKEKINEVNVEGTRLLVKIAEEVQVEKIIYASSISAVSLLKNREANESDYPSLTESYLNEYSKSKIKAEEVFFAESSKTTIKIAANLGVIIGKSKAFEGVLGGVAKSPILPLLPTINSYIGVRDAAKALVFLSRNGINHERYIVTSYNCTNSDFVREVANVLKKKPIFISIPRVVLTFVHFCLRLFLYPVIGTDVWRSMAEDKRFSTVKIKKLGWLPKYTLRESINYLIST